MTGICICLRIGHHGYSAGLTKTTHWGCTPEHAALKARGKPMDEIESKAREAAGKMVGEYLEHLQKTDLATFTPEEFDMLIKTAVESYRDAIDEACQPFGAADELKGRAA